MYLSILLAVQAATAPASAATQADARCAALFSYLVGTQTTADKGPATQGAIFFVGKLLGRNPGTDLGDALASGARDLQKVGLANEQKRCAAEMMSMGQRMIAAGDKVKAQAGE